MPQCGSQIVLCDLPVRFDTYRGCSFGCEYCFAATKRDMSKVAPGESVATLRAWIAGQRTTETNWCDWSIPLHWGGMSDPFQPAELRQGRSLACLRVFADSGYPVVISTKGAAVLGRREYREVLRRCNAVVQVSLVSPALCRHEAGTPSFKRRLSFLSRIRRAARRVIVRVQPYRPEDRKAVIAALPCYADVGVHGVTVEGLKLLRRAPDMVRFGNEHVYPVDVLRPDFEAIRRRCRSLGLAFYCAENRLRRLGDDTCCCGVADLDGWRVCRANLNRTALGRSIHYTRRMRERGTARVFQALCQDTLSIAVLPSLSFADAMAIVRNTDTYRRRMGLRP